MHPTELADRYFASVRARDIDSFAACFAEDAKFILHNGSEISGAAAIREMEQGVFATSPPMPTPMAMVFGDNAFAVEVHVTMPDGAVLRMATFFQLNGDGLIQRLSGYRQGG